MNYLGLCSIVKDETPYLEEWVAYHILVGVERFVIYDNGSAEPVAQTLSPYVDEGLVRVVDWPGQGVQLSAYDDCLKRFGPTFSWLGFIDIDEFVVPIADDDLRVLLYDYEEQGGLAVHWSVYTSAGLDDREGTHISDFRSRLEHSNTVHRLFKSFVRPERTLHVVTPHSFAYVSGWHCVNDQFMPVIGPAAPFTGERIRLNHYYYRSRREWAEKMARGLGHPVRGRKEYLQEEFERQLKQPSVLDECALKYEKGLRFLLRQQDAQAACARAAQWLERTEGQVLELAIRQGESDRTSQAIRTLKLGLFHHSESPILRTALGGMLRRAGALRESEQALNRSLARAPLPETYYELMLTLAASGRSERATRTAEFLRWGLRREDRLDSAWEARIDAALAGTE